MIAQESGDDTAEKEVEAVEDKIKELEQAKAKLESYETYVENWRKAMEQAHQIASKKASKASTKGTRQFDKKARAVLLEPGDRVLVRNLRETGGPGKIRANWEKDIYIVTQQKGTNVPVLKSNENRDLEHRAYCIVIFCFHVHIYVMKANMIRTEK
jgi:chromosome segregation ATPase